MMALCLSLYFHDTLSGGCIINGCLDGTENLTFTDTFFKLLVTKLDRIGVYYERRQNNFKSAFLFHGLFKVI